MDIEFKEKTFETYFGYEVARQTNITYSPDQCDEEFLGFDAAFLVPGPFLFGLTPYRRRSRLRRLQNGISLQNLEQIAQEIASRMPRFKFNLFVQYKRPVYLLTRGAAQWQHWEQKYYRYDITAHQQAILEKIDSQSQGRAATVYASPAFWKSDVLFAHAEAASVIANSNIASVGRLSGHGRYSYIQAGFQGKGHSGTTDIQSPSLQSIIAQGLEAEAIPLNQHLKRAAALIRQVVQTSDVGRPIFQAARRALADPVTEEGSLVESIMTIKAFSDAFNASFYAIG